MRRAACSVLARLRPLPLRLRIAHLAALLRCEANSSPRLARLKQLLVAQSAARDGRAG
jgi:hypothetical protein